MRKISVFFAVVLAVWSLEASAQGVIKFDSETHDFGNIKEGNVATHEFRFTNTGNAPIILSKVQASCGCTTPEWTRDPVLPGKSGTIIASYNSSGRPGAFTKTITVTSNATEDNKVLTIKGMVENKAAAPMVVTEEMKAKSPRFTLASNSTHNFGKLEKGQKVTAKFTVKNTGKDDLVVRSVNSACNCVTHRITPLTIKPGETGTLELSYTPRTLGDRKETVSIMTSDVVTPETQVILSANVVESLAAPSVVKEGVSAVPFK